MTTTTNDQIRVSADSAVPASAQAAVAEAPTVEEAREDRWAALFLLFFAGLFIVILLWEPLSSLLR